MSFTRAEAFMQEAVIAAYRGMREGWGGPFGCVIVRNDTIVGTGCNQVLRLNDPTAHAEIIAIRDACRNLKHYQLEQCEIYTTCEPCPICMGAVYWARPTALYYACERSDASAAGFDDTFIYHEINVAMEERAIPFQKILFPGAKDLFKEWMHSPLKKFY